MTNQIKMPATAGTVKADKKTNYLQTTPEEAGCQMISIARKFAEVGRK